MDNLEANLTQWIAIKETEEKSYHKSYYKTGYKCKQDGSIEGMSEESSNGYSSVSERK